MPEERSTLGDVEPTTAAILGGLAGLLIGFLVWAAITMTDRERAPEPQPEPEVPRGVGDVLAVLRSSGVVVDHDGRPSLGYQVNKFVERSQKKAAQKQRELEKKAGKLEKKAKGAVSSAQKQLADQHG